MLILQAGKPLSSDSKEGNIPSVGFGNPAPSGQWGVGLQKTNGFDFKPAGVSGGGLAYTPRPGDIVIYKGSGVSHVNLVIAVSGTTMTTIGGNQGSSDQQGEFFMGSKVSKNDRNGFSGSNIQGYVTPD